MSGLPTPSKSKLSKIIPRGQASKDASVNGRSSGMSTPGAVSRENSFTSSQLPVMKRESSTPNMKQSTKPQMGRESSIPQIKRESSVPQLRRESSTPQVRKEPAKTPSRAPSAPGLVKREGSASQIKRPASTGVKPRGASAGSSADEPLKIGDRVNITGTSKNGVIQFIGETRFANGEWAGIVLDTPVGKNDGAVAGIRYFQCQPNHGVFVKLEKLKKTTDVKEKESKPAVASTTVADRFKSVDRANTPVRTPDSNEIPKDLTVGDKVSMGDSRTGILRYLGETGFAKGVWCGVELQEPVGKNDGAVAGTRYFQCEPKYGLFAPAHKIKKIASAPAASSAPSESQSDSSAAPAVAEEKTSRSAVIETPAPIEEASQKTVPMEKHDTVLTSQIASLQMQLQDRENEIKEFLKEREHDRNEANSMLQRFQQSENMLTSLRISHDKLLRESDEEIKRLQASLAITEKSKGVIEVQLEEERRKLEDLQFQLEEQIVTKELSSEADKEATKILEEELAAKDEEIKNLQNELEASKLSEEDLRNKNSDLEFLVNETNEREIQSTQTLNVLQTKLKELESALNQAQSESDSQVVTLNEELLKKEAEMQSLKEKLKAKDAVNSDVEFQIKKYREELNETIESKGALNKTIFELNAKLESKDVEIASFQTNVDSLKSDNQDVRSKLKAAESKVESLLSENEKLEAQVSELTKSSGDTSSQVNYLNEELHDLKRKYTTVTDENSQLSINLENLRENSANEKENLTKDLKRTQEEKEIEVNKLKENVSQLENNLSKTKQLKDELEQKFQDTVEKLTTANNANIEITNGMKKKDEFLKTRDEEILSLKAKVNEYETLTSSSQVTIKDLQEKLEEKSRMLESAVIAKENLEKQSVTATSSQEEMKSELESLRRDYESIKSDFTNLSNEKLALEAQKDEVRKEYESKDEKANLLENEKCEIEKQKTSLEEICSSLKKECESLKEQLKQANQDAQGARDEAQRIQGDLSRGSDATNKLQHELTLTKEKLSSCSERISHLETSKSQVENEFSALKEENLKQIAETTKLSSLCENSETTIKQLKTEKESLIEREKVMKQDLEEARLQMQNSVESALSQLQQKEGELSSWRVKAQNFEKKITDQESTIKTLQSQLVNGEVKGPANTEIEGQSSLSEELESKESEIRFLNSLVVDLQNKYKEAEAKIKLIEEGGNLFESSFGLDVEESPIRPGLKQRVFCDICDEFDVHDTEDCPTQSSTEDIGTQYHAQRGEERPFCTICEVFGHKTEDCDDEETF